ncbi:hypothetical protein RCH08_001689 [Janthinobacterium sp. CG_S6]|nr:hypothetical protein [Janthinobacterium sp. CG_S6]
MWRHQAAGFLMTGTISCGTGNAGPARTHPYALISVLAGPAYSGAGFFLCRRRALYWRAPGCGARASQASMAGRRSLRTWMRYSMLATVLAASARASAARCDSA